MAAEFSENEVHIAMDFAWLVQLVVAVGVECVLVTQKHLQLLTTERSLSDRKATTWWTSGPAMFSDFEKSWSL